MKKPKEIFNYLSHKLKDNFVCHLHIDDWGGAVLVMQRNGNAFARTYWLNDEEPTIYFDWLSVDECDRCNGIGTELLNSHIEMAKEFDFNTTLWVKKNTWMHEWYKRKGYEDYQDYEEEGYDAIWMCITNKKYKV